MTPEQSQAAGAFIGSILLTIIVGLVNYARTQRVKKQVKAQGEQIGEQQGDLLNLKDELFRTKNELTATIKDRDQAEKDRNDAYHHLGGMAESLKLVAQALEGFRDGVNDRLDAVAGNTVLAIRPDLTNIVKRIDERSAQAQQAHDTLTAKADDAAKVLELVAGNIDKLPEQFKVAIRSEIVPLVTAISKMDTSIDKQHLERKQQLSELQDRLYHFFEKFSAPIAPAVPIPAPSGEGL